MSKSRDINTIRREVYQIVFGEKTNYNSAPQGINAYLKDIEAIYQSFNVRIKMYNETREKENQIRAFTSARSFRMNLNGDGIQRTTIPYWEAILTIASELYEELSNSSFEFDSDKVIPELNMKFSFHPFPDTGLPFFFFFGLSQGLSVALNEIEHWSYNKDLFNTSSTDIILHSLSQAILLEKELNKKFLFVPLFDFSGYGLVVKNKALDDSGSQISLISDAWRNYISDCNFKICVEEKTDFQWVFKKYCETKFNKILTPEEWDAILVKEVSTSSIRDSFIKNDEFDMYCTNWMHYEYLIKQQEVDYTLLHSEDFFSHKNLNGLIFTEDFFKQNTTHVTRLINNWFSSMKLLKGMSSNLRRHRQTKKKSTVNDLLKNYCTKLNERFGTKLSAVDLVEGLGVYNEFYDSLSEAINALSLVSSSLDNYVELSNFYIPSNEMRSVKITEEDITEFIERTKSTFK